MVFGADVAASTREAFRFNVDRILTYLKTLGIDQKDVAARLKVPSSHLSRWRNKGMVPNADALDHFILNVNKLLPADRRIKPEDLFRDPEGFETAGEDLVRELLRRAGYDIKRT